MTERPETLEVVAAFIARARGCEDPITQAWYVATAAQMLDAHIEKARTLRLSVVAIEKELARRATAAKKLPKPEKAED